MGASRPLRVLVVDDSATNRKTLAGLLERYNGVQVVGSAQDGDEALRLAHGLAPDLVTLDLHMPRMDGFTFLRLLMSSRPTPVIVVSSHSGRDNVFKALELGAIDFVAKPSQLLAGQTQELDAQLRRMVSAVQQLVPSNWRRDVRGRRAAQPPSSAVMAGIGGRARAPQATSPGPRLGAFVDPVARGAAARSGMPDKLLVVASSTGGPTALLELFSRLPSQASAAVVVAQHMPERFTRTFAERLNRLSAFSVCEAADGQPIEASGALVCPGGRCVEVERRDGRLFARVVWPEDSDRYAPSADRLFSSAAQAAGARVVGVVLTGMGDDGAQGVVDVHHAGGACLAESVETAVVYGMPRAAELTGKVQEVLPLGRLVHRVVEMLS